MKMERSFYLKKRRADFVAGYLKGRVVVAGGLGEALGDGDNTSKAYVNHVLPLQSNEILALAGLREQGKQIP